MAIRADLMRGASGWAPRKWAEHRLHPRQLGHPGQRAGDPVPGGDRGDRPGGLEHHLSGIARLAREAALQERGRLLRGGAGPAVEVVLERRAREPSRQADDDEDHDPGDGDQPPVPVAPGAEPPQRADLGGHQRSPGRCRSSLVSTGHAHCSLLRDE